MNTVRVGVIGTGVMGERHCRVCANLPRVQLGGVADLDAERGRMVADRYDTRYFDDVEDLARDVDGVIISTTTPAHYALADTCLRHGCHVMLEKPMTDTTEQAERLVELAAARGLVLQVGYIERFNPAYTELKHVTEGMELIGINIRRLSSFDASNKDVDVIRDLMIHDLDLVTSYVNLDIEEINAWGRSVSSGQTDHAVATIFFKDGPIATLAASRVTEQKVRQIEVTAKGAYVEADLLNKSVMVHRRTLPRYLDVGSTTQYRQESVIEKIFVPSAEPLMLELKHFADCVMENKPSQVPGTDGLRALELAEIVTAKVHSADGKSSHREAFDSLDGISSERPQRAIEER